jgi:hypothetical protein
LVSEDQLKKTEKKNCINEKELTINALLPYLTISNNEDFAETFLERLTLLADLFFFLSER